MSTDILDALNRDVIDYLEGVSDLEKARPPKRRDKDHETHDPSAPDHAALFCAFSPRPSVRGVNS